MQRFRKGAAAAVVSIGATLGLSFGAGASTSPHAAAPPSVVLWSITQPSSQQRVVDNLISKFNSSYPGGGHVSIVWLGGEVWKTKEAVAMSAHQPPAMFWTYGGSLLDQYVQAGQVADLSPSLDADPAWKKAYVAKHVFDLASYHGNIYAIPATGPDFEIMWQNKAALEKAHVAASPATWTQLERDFTGLKKAGITPVAIAGNDVWPEMIWMQYLTLRYGGPGVFDKINALTPGSWNNPAIIKAAQTVQQMARANDFESGFDAVTFASGNADRLLASGEAGFQAQLYYDEANMRVYDPAFAESPDYSAFNFPSVAGGPAAYEGDLVGQPAEYIALSSHLSSAAMKESLAYVKYETTSQQYNVNFLEDNGYTPITQAGANYLLSKKVPQGSLLYSLFKIGTEAPYIQPYWDQDLPSSVITPMLTNISEVFNLTITPQQFVSNLDKVLAAQHKS